MSEQPSEQQVDEPQEGGQPEPKTFDADYVARLRKEAAQYRTEAKANAEAARRLAEIEDANKSEIERASEARAAAERERDDARADALRLRIAAKHGISDDDADLFLTGKDEQTLTAQAKRLADREANTRQNGAVVPREGGNGGGGTGGPAQELADFLRNARGA